MSVAECANCGSAVRADSRFCPECGRPLPTADEEAAPRRSRLDPFVLLIAVVLVGGLILVVGGEWAWSVAVALLAAILLLGRREVERRRAARALASLRARAAAAGEAMAARSREQVELFRARRELAELDAQRGRAFHELGRAAFYDDEAGIESARATVAAVLERMREKEAEIERLREETERRIERAQLDVQPTERLEASPGTARAPEPPTDEEVSGEVPTPPPPSEREEPPPTRLRRSR
jgi:hypothetical protein